MLIMALSFIGTAIWAENQDPAYAMFESEAYTLQASLDGAQLYLDTAALYSLRQAMYENGPRGGFSPATACSEYEYGGRKYCLWNDGTDISPAEDVITDELENVTNSSFSSYLNGSFVVALYPVPIPEYGYPAIRNISGYEAGLWMQGQGPLSVGVISDVTGDETTLTMPSDVNITVSVPYFRMVEIANGVHASLSAASGCSAADIEKEEATECCMVSVDVVDEASCTVIVSVKTKKEFFVWNGTAASMEPIEFAFAEKGTGFALASASPTDEPAEPAAADGSGTGETAPAV
jgi:hypothetical protein